MGRVPSVLSAKLLTLAAVCAWPVAAARSVEPPDQARPANRLARETSPYLRQHAHNPVDWYPWGPEAFAKARDENKLIFLSIGYSSCHWCHVMERESFSNPDIAKALNASFVCVKVDREERPDVDQVYMTAVQLFGQPGGWPLSMFLMPNGNPVAGGTYWPPDDRVIGGQKVLGFRSVLRAVLDLRRDHPKEVEEQSEQAARAVARALARPAGPAGPEPRRYLVTAAADALKAEFDPEYGGFGSPQRAFKGPKFPRTPALELLLQLSAQPKSDDLLGMVTRTLDRMAAGGIYDQLGGGFHRYSTDRTWTVPHFEKMLYDNAQLAELYAAAYKRTNNPLYRRVAEQTLDFVGRELTAPDGGFFSSLDADSEGEEGRYYVWSGAELDSALPDPAENALARATFGIGDTSNAGGKHFVLVRAGGPAEPADARLPDVRQKLLAARSNRVRPRLDMKILTAWNGQMIAGYAAAGRLLDQPRYAETAARAADFVLANLQTADGRLLRSYAAVPGEAPRAALTAYLDDYAYLTHGLLCLHDATGADRWLAEARRLTDLMVRFYGDEAGGFFYTATDHEKLFARAKDVHDGAQPSANGVAVRNLLRLAEKTGEARYRDLAGRALRAFAAELEQNPSGLPTLAAALDQYLDGAGPQPPNRPPAGRPTAGQPGSAAKRSDAVVKATAAADKPSVDGRQTVKLTLTIDKDWHLYANPVGNEGLEAAQTTVAVGGKAKPKSVKVEYPKGKVVKDPIVGDYNVYEGSIEIKAVVERATGDTGPLEVTVKLQACNEKTCLLPATIKLSVP